MSKAEKKELVRHLALMPGIPLLRKRLGSVQLAPLSSPAQIEKAETLNRRLKGLKMPKHVSATRFGFVVRPCVSGIPFVFASKTFIDRPSGEFLARLADCITYHFREFRLRGAPDYNFNEALASQDCVGACALILDEFKKIFASVLRAPGIVSQEPGLKNELVCLRAYVETLEQRISNLERETLCGEAGHICVPVKPLGGTSAGGFPNSGISAGVGGLPNSF